MEQKIISSGGGGMGSKILIAEDEEIISRELKTLLGQAGYQAGFPRAFAANPKGTARLGTFGRKPPRLQRF